VARGDILAFQALYDLYAGPMFAVAFRVLNNQEATEDVLQEAFLQIWEKSPLYDPTRGKPLPWALALVRYKAIDRVRASQRRARLHGDFEQESVTTIAFDDRNSFDAIATEETGALVRDALRKLSPDQRQALELAFFSALSQSEIAERLAVPLGTVKARIRRGMLKLRDLLGPEPR
jgi:RNA polymerase sigma-70 factor (ECF subfamily)